MAGSVRLGDKGKNRSVPELKKNHLKQYICRPVFFYRPVYLHRTDNHEGIFYGN